MNVRHRKRNNTRNHGKKLERNGCGTARLKARRVAKYRKMPVGLKQKGYSNNRAEDFNFLLKNYEYSLGFPKDCLKESECLASKMEIENFSAITDREDFSKDFIFTIDGHLAKDFDDAISLHKIKDQFYLGVHIADVSYFVRPGGALDAEAFRRGTSVYCIDRVLPMLPPLVSNHLCSLVPDENRFTVSCIMRFDAGGFFLGVNFVRSFICSKARVTYREAEDSLQNNLFIGSGVDEKLKEMNELARLLRRNRFASGSIHFETTEQEWQYGEKGEIIGVSPHKALGSEQLIEEFMLAANQAVAGELVTIKTGLFRVHEKPDENKMLGFYEMLKKNHLKLPSTGSENPLFYAGKSRFNTFLKSLKDDVQKQMFSQLLLTAMRQAYYSHRNLGHYGLGFVSYTHFTSPIRRYPDLVVHRQLLGKILGKAENKDVAISSGLHSLEEIGRASSFLERKAVNAEREYKKIKSIRYLQDQPKNRIYPAIVVGFSPKGNCFLRSLETGIEGILLLHRVGGGAYFYETEKEIWQGDRVILKLGTTKNVCVEKLLPEILSIRWRLKS